MFRKLIAMLSILMIMAAVLPTGARTVQAATSALTEMEAVELLQHYSIVRGSPGGQLDLDQPFTRAQAATVFVRTMGFEDLAQSLKSVVPFSDAVGHWAAGEIAMAEQLGLMRGDGNGTFRPDSQISYAEVLTVLLRIVKQEPTGAWNPNVIYTAADRLGFAPRGVLPTTAAVRGKIFWSLASAISQVPLPTGETVLQKYVDQIPPTLTLDRTSVTTADATVTVSGTTRDAVTVLVNGVKADLNPTTGKFTYSATLTTGTNTIAVEARDYAGNVAAATFTAERRGAIASIDIAGDDIVKAGGTSKLTVTAKDSRGNTVALDGIEASLTGDVATFDMRTTTLTAGTKTGRGVLTLTAGTVRRNFTFDVTAPSPQAAKLSIVSINDGRAPAVGRDATVKVQVADDNGRLLTDDYWRTVRLTATGLEGVTVSPPSVATEAGVAIFTIKGIREGTVSLTATSSGLETATTTAQILSSTRVVLSANPSTLKPDGVSSTRISATLQDELGRPVTNNSASDIRINLTATNTDGYFSDSILVIKRGSSTSSGDDAYFKSGVLAGTANISGEITSSHTYHVQDFSLSLTGTPAPVKLQVLPASGRLSPNGAPTEITVQVVDAKGTKVTWGAFAFRLKITTSNGEPVTEGVPEGVTLTFPGLTYGPISGGKNDNAIVGRTHLGVAKIKLGYNKSGMVTLTPETIGIVEEAYHPTIGFGSASSSNGFETQAATFTFAGTPTAIELTADSTLGKDKPAGAVNTSTGMTVRARVVDASGAPVPGWSGSITLTRTSAGTEVTRLSGTSATSATRTTTTGVLEFGVQSTNVEGFDVYTATASGLSPASITMAVRKQKPGTPAVVAIRGRDGDNLSDLGKVSPNDESMEIQLERQDPPNPGEPTYWVNARVVRKGSSTSLVSDYPVDLQSPLPVIEIPTSKLDAGTYVYQVIINDGFATSSDPSPDLGLSGVTVSEYSTTYKLGSTAYLDAATGKLLLQASGLATNGVVDTEKLSITKGTSSIRLNPDQVTVASVTATAVTLQLNDLVADFDPAVFNGAVNVVAADGWYTTADGTRVAKGSNTTVLKPAANITNATLDKGSKVLYLYGSGFLTGTGTPALDRVHIGDVALRPGSTTSTDRITGTTTDSKITITLSQATYDAITALTGNVAVTAEAGWIKATVSSTVYNSAALEGNSRPLQMAVTVSRFEYSRADNTLTITGKGLSDATLDPTKLTFRRSTSLTPTYRFTSGTTATADSDTTITIHLSDTDAAYFESSTGFSGREVVVNTDTGWLFDDQGRPADRLTTDRHKFTVDAR